MASRTTANSPTRALITGASAGIGREFAEQLAARGTEIVLVARDRTRLDDVAADLAERHGVRTEVLAADLTDRSSLAEVEARLGDAENPIDLLVNNAGFGLKGRFLDNDIEDEQRMLDILVTAVLRLSHASLRAMSESGGGAIVNVSSVAGFLPRGTYSAAKAWVTSFSEWAGAEYADRDVKVMALCPGFVHTEFHGRMGVAQNSAPSALWLEAPDVVRTALADLAKGKRVSVPSVRYQAIVAASKLVPTGLLQRAQSMGRG